MYNKSLDWLTQRKVKMWDDLKIKGNVYVEHGFRFNCGDIEAVNVNADTIYCDGDVKVAENIQCEFLSAYNVVIGGNLYCKALDVCDLEVLGDVICEKDMHIGGKLKVHGKLMCKGQIRYVG